MSSAFDGLIAECGVHAGEEGPVKFVAKALGARPDPWQEDVLRAYGANERQIAVKSCHGPGKTCVAAWCITHQLFCRFPQRTMATAPSAPQLHGVLMPEVKKWIGRMDQTFQDLVEIQSERIYLKANQHESDFKARTARADAPEAVAGLHCEGGHVLWVGDEASGIPEIVYESVYGSMSGDYVTMLLIGNPVRPQGFFHGCFHRSAARWKTFTVSHADSTRVTDEYVDGVALQWGRDSNAFRVRCLGEFPESDGDTVIPFELIHAAQKRQIDVPADEPEVWGGDIARKGKDMTALCGRTRRAVTRLHRWGKADLMSTVGKIKRIYDEAAAANRAPKAIYIDVIGMGAGVVDRLQEFGIPVVGVNVSENATVSEKYHRMRDELWFSAAEWLEGNDRRLPAPDPNLALDMDDAQALGDELAGPTWRDRSNGTMEVESKDDTRKRLGKSPDMADAFCLTFAGDNAILAYGSQGSMAWDQPLTRPYEVSPV